MPVHTKTSPVPCYSSPSSPKPSLWAASLFARHPAMDWEPAPPPDKPVYTTEMPIRGRETNQLRPEAPNSRSVSSEDLYSWPCLKHYSAHYINVSVKDTINSNGEYTPRTLGLWVGWFFIKSCLYPHIMENVPLG